MPCLMSRPPDRPVRAPGRAAYGEGHLQADGRASAMLVRAMVLSEIGGWRETGGDAPPATLCTTALAD
jgi:hypothetical protein